jgi:hypothetical protein
VAGLGLLCVSCTRGSDAVLTSCTSPPYFTLQFTRLCFPCSQSATLGLQCKGLDKQFIDKEGCRAAVEVLKRD